MTEDDELEFPKLEKRTIGKIGDAQFKDLKDRIFEQNTLIRELEESVAGLIVGHVAKDALIRELLRVIVVIDGRTNNSQLAQMAKDALARARAQGFEP